MGVDVVPPALGEALDLAAEAVDLAPSEPGRARTLLARLDGQAGRDPEVASLAARARGLIALAGGDTATGLDQLRGAVRRAERAGLAERAAEARMSLSFARFLSGDTAGALHETDLAAPALRGVPAARLRMQRALILARMGRTAEALAGYRQALPVLRRAGDGVWEAKLRLNRAWLHAYRGDWRAAAADLERLGQLAEGLGSDALAAEACHNLGFLAAIQGDVPLALARYDAAEARYREAGRDLAPLLLDRSEVLLAVGLATEGLRAAHAAVTETSGSRMAADLAEARLMVARAGLASGDPAVAARSAEDAQRDFRRQGRAAWSSLARFVVLRARWADGVATPALLHAARRTADDLTAAGWPAAALEARVMAGRVALVLGRPQVAERELSRAAAARRRGPAELRVQAWYAEALRRLADGQEVAAFRALDAGLRAVEEFRAALGASDLRTQSSGLGTELAETGLRLALRGGRPATILAWSERWRAGVLRLERVRPPADPALADALAQLRRVHHELEQVRGEGRDDTALLRQQVAFEAVVRRRARHAAGGGAAVARPTPAQLHEALGDRALLEVVIADGVPTGLVACGGRLRTVPLGDRTAALGELANLRFALTRLARGRGSARGLAAASASVRASAQRLDALLIAPVHAAIGDRPLVLVPSGPFHALPWALLPSLAGRPVAVAPSAAWWHRVACAPQRAGGHTVLVAGPRLEHAEQEVADIARLLPAATALSGERATAAAVTAALDGADLVHIAAHGRFRADNALFSRLELADGPLTVYELERLDAVPDTLVLSACESGLSEVRPGDELMGVTAALFALGTRTVVASVAPVSDAATRTLMLAFHRHLAATGSPATALAQAQLDVDPADGEAAAFVCFGAG